MEPSDICIQLNNLKYIHIFPEYCFILARLERVALEFLMLLGRGVYHALPGFKKKTLNDGATALKLSK